MKLFRNTVLVIAAFIVAEASFAQTYPARPVRFIIGFPPGTIIDGSARLVASEMEKRLGQPIVLEFKPGANGTIGAKYVVTANPDGYTLCYCNVLGTHPIFNKNNAVDARKDFAPVSQFITTPWLVFSSGKLPVSSFRDLVAFSKANPDRLQYGSQTANINLVMHMLRERTGVAARPIPYKGSPQAIIALIAGEIDLGSGTILAFLPHVRAGKIRALFVASATRSTLLPDVPTAAEAGIPNFEMALNYGLWGPLNMPSDLVKKLSVESTAALKIPAVAEKLRQAYGADPVGSTPEDQLRAFDSEIKFWTEAARLANYKPD